MKNKYQYVHQGVTVWYHDTHYTQAYSDENTCISNTLFLPGKEAMRAEDLR